MNQSELYSRAFHKKNCKESNSPVQAYDLFAKNSLLTCQEWQTYISLAGEKDLSIYSKALDQCSFAPISLLFLKEVKVQMQSELIQREKAIEIADRCVSLCGLDWDLGEQICEFLQEFHPDSQKERLESVKKDRESLPSLSVPWTSSKLKETVCGLSFSENPSRVKAFIELFVARNPLDFGLWKVLLEFLQDHLPDARLLAKTCKRALLAFPLNLELCILTLSALSTFEKKEEIEDFFQNHIQRYSNDQLVSLWLWRISTCEDSQRYAQYSNAISFISKSSPNANTWPIHLRIINWFRTHDNHSAARQMWEALISSCKQYQMWKFFAEDEKNHQNDLKILGSIYKRALAICPESEHSAIYADWASNDPLNLQARVKSLCLAKEAKIENKLTLFVSNLNYKVTQQALENFFKKRNISFLEVRIPMGREGGGGESNSSRGFAYVDVASEEDFSAALALDRTPLMGRPVYITPFKKDHQTSVKRKRE